MDWNKALLLTKLGIFFALDLAGVIGTAGITVFLAAIVAMATNPVFGACAALPAFGAGMVGRRWICAEYARIFMPEVLRHDSFEEALKSLNDLESKKDEDEEK